MDFKHSLQALVVFIFISLMVSCGGGGGSETNHGSSTMSNSSVHSLSATSSSSAPDPNVIRYTEPMPNFALWDSKTKLGFAGFFINGLDFYNSDGSYGVTKLERENSYLARPGGTTYFHLGSIEFYPVPSSDKVSIFNLLRNYNHKSNEVLNLVRLLMILDDNRYSGNLISISEKSKDIVKNQNIFLSDLFLDVEDFSQLEKIKETIRLLNVSKIPSATEAEDYLVESFNDFWGLGNVKNNDFDSDGVLNSDDDFPWDNSQSQDSDGDSIGDAAQIEYKIIETRGVKKYAVDSINGFLYIADHNKKLSRYDLKSGNLLLQIDLPGVITSMDVSTENSDLYISTTEKYVYGDYISVMQPGQLHIMHAASHKIDSVIDLDAYPTDIKIVNNKFLVISTLDFDFFNQRLMVFKIANNQLVQDIKYAGFSGSMIAGKSKLLVQNFNAFSIFNISDEITYYAGIGLAGEPPVFIVDRIDSAVDGSGNGIRLSFNSDESSLFDLRTPYINFSFYDSSGLMTGFGVDYVLDDDNSNQYYGLSTAPYLYYINRDSLMVSGRLYFNLFGIDINEFANKNALGVMGNNLFVISELSNGSTQISKLPHPCSNCGLSGSPIATIAMKENYVDIQKEIELDGGQSIDSEDGKNLSYRWDYNSDGIWDTNFSNNSLCKIKFDSSGEKQITLQVKDSSGLTDETTLSLDLDYGIYSGEPPESENLEQIQVSIHDAEFDKKNRLIYVISSETSSMYAISSITGNVVRQYKFRSQPNQMVYSESEDLLYVGFGARGCVGDMYRDCDNDTIGLNEGFVQKFDLTTQVFVDSFDINIDPGDLFVLNDQLFISTNDRFKDRVGSDFNAGISIYNRNTYEFIEHLDSLPREYGDFESILDVINYPLSEVCCFEQSAYKYLSYGNKTIVSKSNFLPYSWSIPNSDQVIESYGKIYNLINLELINQIAFSKSGSEIKSADFDEMNNRMVIGSIVDLYSKGTIDYYELDSFKYLGSFSLQNQPAWVFVSANQIISLGQVGVYTYRVTLLDMP